MWKVVAQVDTVSQAAEQDREKNQRALETAYLLHRKEIQSYRDELKRQERQYIQELSGSCPCKKAFTNSGQSALQAKISDLQKENSGLAWTDQHQVMNSFSKSLL